MGMTDETPEEEKCAHFVSVVAEDVYLLYLHSYKYIVGGSYTSYRVTKCRDKGKQSDWKELVRENWGQEKLGGSTV